MSEQKITPAALRTAFKQSIRNSLVVALILVISMAVLRFGVSPEPNAEAHAIVLGFAALLLVIVLWHMIGNIFFYWTHPVRRAALPDHQEPSS